MIKAFSSRPANVTSTPWERKFKTGCSTEFSISKGREYVTRPNNKTGLLYYVIWIVKRNKKKKDGDLEKVGRRITPTLSSRRPSSVWNTNVKFSWLCDGHFDSSGCIARHTPQNDFSRPRSLFFFPSIQINVESRAHWLVQNSCQENYLERKEETETLEK